MMNERDLGRKARELLFEKLSSIRVLEVNEHVWAGRETDFPSDPGYDVDIKVKEKGAGGKEWRVCAEVKSHGHPKKVREAAFWLKRRLGSEGRAKSRTVSRAGGGRELGVRQSDASEDVNYPVFIAPYISPEAAQVCEEEEIGYLDFSGNCHLVFGGVYIHVTGRPNRYKDKRGVKSLFSPKAARVLRVLLQGPLKTLKVKQIESAAAVSLGLVSGIRKKLIEQEWARSDANGLHVTQPGKILDAWAEADDWNKRTETREYSLLESDLEGVAELVKEVLSETNQSWAFTQWFAGWLRVPYTIPPIVSVYVSNFPDEGVLKSKLGARRVEAGSGRLRFIRGTDHYGLLSGIQDVRGFPCVSDVQIYLDLISAGQRGREQAEELRLSKDFSGGWK